MKREPVQTDAAPAAIGTYSQAIRAGDTLYLSGQIPLDPTTGDMVNGDIRAQIRQVFDNLAAVAGAAGASLNNAVKINVFLVDLAHFGEVNEIMMDYLQSPYPARAAVQVAALPRGAAVEADAIIAL
ncbi:MAG: RidA family protein [Chromatiales bacterium]|nr:MAG: RidA family protein [Chromatiales bacterium]